MSNLISNDPKQFYNGIKEASYGNYDACKSRKVSVVKTLFYPVLDLLPKCYKSELILNNLNNLKEQNATVSTIIQEIKAKSDLSSLLVEDRIKKLNTSSFTFNHLAIFAYLKDSFGKDIKTSNLYNVIGLKKSAKTGKYHSTQVQKIRKILEDLTTPQLILIENKFELLQFIEIAWKSKQKFTIKVNPHLIPKANAPYSNWDIYGYKKLMHQFPRNTLAQRLFVYLCFNCDRYRSYNGIQLSTLFERLKITHRIDAHREKGKILKEINKILKYFSEWQILGIKGYKIVEDTKIQKITFDYTEQPLKKKFRLFRKRRAKNNKKAT